MNVKSSSIPSRVVIASTSFVYVLLMSNTWIGSLSWLNDVPLLGAIILAVVTFLITSFTRVHLGQCYPSDIIVTIIPTAVVFMVFYLFFWIDSQTWLCPSCGDNAHSYCYFGDLPDSTLITRKTFELTSLNFTSTMVMGLTCYAIFSVFSWYPIEFW